MRINLPARAGVVSLRLDDRKIRVGARGIGAGLAKQQQIFRHATAHLGGVLALLSPAQPVGLIVIAHYVGDDGLHAHIGKAVAGVVLNAPDMKGIDSLEAEASHAAGNDAVLDVDDG